MPAEAHTPLPAATPPAPPGPLRRLLLGRVRATSALAAQLSEAWQDARAERLPLPSGDRVRLTIGRDRECDLVLADPTVSRRHAELRRVGDDWLVADFGSTNGTRLNGMLVAEPATIRPGDAIEIGGVRLRVTPPRPG